MSLNDLNQMFSIVDPNTGKPTDYFMRLLRDRGVEVSNVEELVQILKTEVDKINGTNINAGPGLTGGGVIGTDDPITLSANVQQILNQITSTRGTVLFRGATDWQALAPGSPGFFLKTNGPGADPEWAAGGGSGGGGNWWYDPPLASSFTTLSFDATNLTLTDDSNEGLLIRNPGSGAGYRTAYRTLTNKTLDWTCVVRLSAFAINTGNTEFGLFLQDSVSGRVTIFGFERDNSFVVTYWSGLTTFSSRPFSTSNTNLRTSNNWLRVQFTGGNLVFSLSVDGKNWAVVRTEAATSWLTNRADRIGFGIYRDGAAPALLSCQRFSLTGPGV